MATFGVSWDQYQSLPAVTVDKLFAMHHEMQHAREVAAELAQAKRENPDVWRSAAEGYTPPRAG